MPDRAKCAAVPGRDASFDASQIATCVSSSDHFIASHSTSIGEMMSPVILTLSFQTAERARALYRPDAAPDPRTGSPFLVMISLSPEACDLVDQGEAFGLEFGGFD